jgi:histidinol-phosphate aminotransferase
VRDLGIARNVFDVNSVAQAAAVASVAEADALLPERVSLNATERETVVAGLRGLGLAPLPSEANFILVDLGSPERALAVNAALLARGVIVRQAWAFGASPAPAQTIGFAEENARFLAAAPRRRRGGVSPTP